MTSSAPFSYDREISDFFDELCATYISHGMEKYINMEALRGDFVRETQNAIDALVESCTGKNALDVESLEDHIGDACGDIPFWLNSFEPGDNLMEAEGTISDFLLKMVNMRSCQLRSTD